MKSSSNSSDKTVILLIFCRFSSGYSLPECVHKVWKSLLQSPGPQPNCRKLQRTRDQSTSWVGLSRQKQLLQGVPAPRMQQQSFFSEITWPKATVNTHLPYREERLNIWLKFLAANLLNLDDWTVWESRDFPCVSAAVVPHHKRGHHAVEKQAAAGSMWAAGPGRPRGSLGPSWRARGQFFPSWFGKVHMNCGCFVSTYYSLVPVTLQIWFISSHPHLLFWAARQNDVMGSLKVYRKFSKLNDFNLLYSVCSCDGWLSVETTPCRTWAGSLRTRDSPLLLPSASLSLLHIHIPTPHLHPRALDRGQARWGREAKRMGKLKKQQVKGSFLRKTGVQDSQGNWRSPLLTFGW
jgi:hypothetical protein